MSRNFFHRGFRFMFANGGISLRHSSSIEGFSPIQLASNVRLFSRYVTHERPFVISYLIDSCGLSADSAKTASKTIDFENPNRPDSVLKLLKQDYGFSVSQISKIIHNVPQILLADPTKILLPKLQFLSSIVNSSLDLREIVCSNPNILRRSLNDTLIPTYNVLKTLLESEKEVILCLKKSAFGFCIPEYASSNLALLRKLGVRDKQLSSLLTSAPWVLLRFDAIKFSGNVNRVIELGFNPWEKMFVHALRVISRTSHEARKQKVEACKSWGLSEEEILSAFKKYPYILTKSVKKIAGTMDFLVNKIEMDYRPADIIRVPAIFGYSLEKRIVPRFSVIRVLQMKGLVKVNMPISTVITTTEATFLNDYVIKYEAEVPQLIDIYRGKMSIQELVREFLAEKCGGG